MTRRIRMAGLFAVSVAVAGAVGCTAAGQRTDPYQRHFDLGYEAYRSGRWQAAADNFTHYLQAYPSSPHRAEAYHFRGLARVKLERRQEALNDFDRAVRSPASQNIRSLAYVAMGNLYYEDGRDADAVSAFERGLRVPAPEVPEDRVLLRLAISLQRLGRWREADGYLARAISRYPGSAAAGEARRRYHVNAFAVQTGAFASRRRADEEAQRLQRAGFRPRTGTVRHEGQTLHTVQVGRAHTYAEARTLAQQVNQAGFAAMVVP